MNKKGISLIAVFAAASLAAACGGGAANTTTNNSRNMTNMGANNANVGAVVVNSNTNTAASNANRWSNANSVTRDQYDKQRADYERDKGSSIIGSGPNDSWLWFKTRAALMTADDLRDSTINVDVENGKITLKGTVANAAQKASAEKVAKGIEGQSGVTNQLMVKPADSMTNTSSNTGSNSNVKR